MRKRNQIRTLGAPHYKAHYQLLRNLKDFNTFGAEWHIYASYVQMHRVWIDAYMRHSI